MYTSALYGHKYDKSQQISAISEENQSARHHTALAPLLFAVLFFPLQLMYLLPPTRTKTTERNETRRNPEGRKRLGRGKEEAGSQDSTSSSYLQIFSLCFPRRITNHRTERASEGSGAQLLFSIAVVIADNAHPHTHIYLSFLSLSMYFPLHFLRSWVSV